MRGYTVRFLVAVFVASLVCCLAVPAFSADVFRLKYASFMPPTHRHSALSEQWGKELEKRTNGRVKVSFFPAGTLMSAAQTYDGVVKGITDVGFSVVAYTPGRMPFSDGLTLPLGYKSGAQATRLVNAFYAKFKPKEYDDVKVLYLHAHGPGFFHTKKPVNKMEDLKGLRIKGDALTAKIISAVGAAPTSIPMLELYDSLKRGVAEGAIFPCEALDGWKMGEVCHYTYENDGIGYANPFFVAMNKAKWNSLPPDIQQIISKLDEEWIEKTAQLWNDLEDDARAVLTKKGHKFTKANQDEEARMREKMKPLLADYVKNMKERNVPGDEVIRWTLEYLKTAPAK